MKSLISEPVRVVSEAQWPRHLPQNVVHVPSVRLSRRADDEQTLLLSLFKVSGRTRFIGRHVFCKFDYTAYTPNA